MAGIALGFAAKDTLANFISGIFILGDAPYRVGEYIIIDGETRGMVTDIVQVVVGSGPSQVTGLMGEGVDPHLYKPTSHDVRRSPHARTDT